MIDSRLITASLDLLNEGFGVFDTDLKLVASNRAPPSSIGIEDVRSSPLSPAASELQTPRRRDMAFPGLLETILKVQRRL